MGIPAAYLTTRKRLPDMLEAIKTAQAPEKFTQKFLETLEFKNKTDRLFINLLKSLNFIDDTGKPTHRYHEYLDQTQSELILADGIKEAYSDLFAVNTKANELTKQEVQGKLKTLSQGQYSEGVLSHMADTFAVLCKQADFKQKSKESTYKISDTTIEESTNKENSEINDTINKLDFGGLVYNIQIVLPETRDQAVYDALFKSLKQHLQ